MNKDELKSILEQHRLWIDGNGGKRGDPQRANLRSAVSDWQSMTSHVTNPSDSQGIVTRNGGEG